MLAIIAPSFVRPSETFIRSHAYTIAPGRTILVCLDHHGVNQFPGAVLSDLDWVRPGRLQQRVVSGIFYRWRRYVRPGLSPTSRLRILEFLREHRPMAALAEYGPVGVQFASVCRAAKVPLFVHFHGYDGSLLLRDSVVVRNYGRLFRLASGIIAPSRFLAKNLLAIGCPPDKLHVIPYGIDPTRLTITRRDPQRILAVGRLVDKKAPHLTIRAFGQIASDYPKAQLDMLGDGPLAETCSSLITDLGLEGRVRMHGAQPHSHVVQLMGEASIFVQHSVTAANGDTEGLPVAILEAMASALPVVATRHSGIPEAVVDGTTGLLVEEHDVDAMASALSQLLADPELGEHMGLAGRKRALDQFAQQRSIDRFRTIMGLPTLATGGLASPCLDGANRCGEASCDQQA